MSQFYQHNNYNRQPNPQLDQAKAALKQFASKNTQLLVIVFLVLILTPVVKSILRKMKAGKAQA